MKRVALNVTDEYDGFFRGKTHVLTSTASPAVAASLGARFVRLPRFWLIRALDALHRFLRDLELLVRRDHEDSQGAPGGLDLAEPL